MEPTDAAVRPETHALDALIRETLHRQAGEQHRAAEEGGSSTPDALLFLGNPHHAFPVLVVQDPVLEPVDKLVWMVICLSAQRPGQAAPFPGYAQIGRLANVNSTSTIARAIAILRLTRWLSLCARSRDHSGRFGGNVYALHDEPLPLVDALHLDPGYMRFLDNAMRHHHARVRRVAQAINTTLDVAISTGNDVLAPANPMERRMLAQKAVQDGADATVQRPFFSFSGAVLASLSNAPPSAGTAAGPRADAGAGQAHHHQKSKSVADQGKTNTPCDRNTPQFDACSSSKIKKTTTTTLTSTSVVNTRAREAAPITLQADASVDLELLNVPARLKDNQRALAARYLATIEANQRQPVLDELAGRLLAEQRGATPVYDPLRYLHTLCQKVSRGEFVPNLALGVQAERQRRDQARSRALAEEQQREQEASARRSTALPPGENPLIGLRELLGMGPPEERE